MSEAYMIMVYNALDADFGYDCGPFTFMDNLNKSVAKSIARHYNKISPDFISYDVCREPDRYY